MSGHESGTQRAKGQSLTEQRHRLVPPDVTRKLGFLIFIVVVGIVWLAKEVLSPIALAGLLAMLLVPVVRWLEGKRVPRAPAAIGVVIVMAVLIGGIAWFIGGQLTAIVRQMPSYRDNIHQRLAPLHSGGTDVFQIADTTLTHIRQEMTPDQVADPAKKRAKSEDKEPMPVTIEPHSAMTGADIIALTSSILQPIATVGIVIFFSIFMLIQRDDLHERFLRLSSRMVGRGGMSLSAEALDDATSRITRYLLMQSLTNLASGVVIGVGLFLIGVPNAFLWGLMTFLLRYVPYVGVLLAGMIVGFFTIAVSPDWSLTLLALGLFLTVEILIGNVLEPLYFGHGTGLSSIAVMVAATFWTWIWGPVGLFLSVPLTVCLVVLGRYVPTLDFLEILLAERGEAKPRAGARTVAVAAPAVGT